MHTLSVNLTQRERIFHRAAVRSGRVQFGKGDRFLNSNRGWRYARHEIRAWDAKCAIARRINRLINQPALGCYCKAKACNGSCEIHGEYIEDFDA